MYDPWLSPDMEKNSYERQFEDNWKNVSIDQVVHDTRNLLMFLDMIMVLSVAFYIRDEHWGI